jgi:hypothetical protein
VTDRRSAPREAPTGRRARSRLSVAIRLQRGPAVFFIGAQGEADDRPGRKASGAFDGDVVGGDTEYGGGADTGEHVGRDAMRAELQR